MYCKEISDERRIEYYNHKCSDAQTIKKLLEGDHYEQALIHDDKSGFSEFLFYFFWSEKDVMQMLICDFGFPIHKCVSRAEKWATKEVIQKYIDNGGFVSVESFQSILRQIIRDESVVWTGENDPTIFNDFLTYCTDNGAVINSDILKMFVERCNFFEKVQISHLINLSSSPETQSILDDGLWKSFRWSLKEQTKKLIDCGANIKVFEHRMCQQKSSNLQKQILQMLNIVNLVDLYRFMATINDYFNDRVDDQDYEVNFPDEKFIEEMVDLGADPVELIMAIFSN